MAYLERYLNGEHRQVWSELQDLGDEIYSVPLYSECYAVALETMTRVRRNIELLISRLRDIEYVFHAKNAQDLDFSLSNPPQHIFEDECIILPESYDFESEIAAIEAMVGAIPLSIKAFYRVIGAVNLVGRYPPWQECHLLDSLQVNSPKMALFWLKTNYEPIEYQAATIIISPDKYHKIGMSGAGVYSMRMPNRLMDCVVEDEPHQLYFVDYLRLSLQWAGMLGIEKCPQIPNAEISHLIDGFMPF